MGSLDFKIAKEDFISPWLIGATEDQFEWAYACHLYVLENDSSLSDAFNFYELDDPVVATLVGMYGLLVRLNQGKRLPLLLDLDLRHRYWSLLAYCGHELTC
ncbi:MAG: hypothetical protein ACKOXU_13965 [Limnohabitans sp.]